MSKKQNNNVTTAQQSMYRFTIEVTSLQTSTVRDNETGKVYTCKNVWYTRNNFKRFYVNVESVEARQMKSMFSFPWQAEITADGKLKGTNPTGMIHETNLAGKQAALISEDMFV